MNALVDRIKKYVRVFSLFFWLPAVGIDAQPRFRRGVPAGRRQVEGGSGGRRDNGGLAGRRENSGHRGQSRANAWMRFIFLHVRQTYPNYGEINQRLAMLPATQELPQDESNDTDYDSDDFFEEEDVADYPPGISEEGVSFVANKIASHGLFALSELAVVAAMLTFRALRHYGLQARFSDLVTSALNFIVRPVAEAYSTQENSEDVDVVTGATLSELTRNTFFRLRIFVVTTVMRHVRSQNGARFAIARMAEREIALLLNRAALRASRR